jgi:hypothetical protein
MLELITSRKPIMEQEAMDKTKDLYNLHEFLDPVIGFGPTLKGLETNVCGSGNEVCERSRI